MAAESWSTTSTKMQQTPFANSLPLKLPNKPPPPVVLPLHHPPPKQALAIYILLENSVDLFSNWSNCKEQSLTPALRKIEQECRNVPGLVLIKATCARHPRLTCLSPTHSSLETTPNRTINDYRRRHSIPRHQTWWPRSNSRYVRIPTLRIHSTATYPVDVHHREGQATRGGSASC